MAEENLNLIEPVPSPDANHPMQPDAGVMAGTPVSGAETNWENIKDGLIVEGSDTAQGDYDVEGLARAEALHTTVVPFSPNINISGEPKDEDINNAFSDIVQNTYNRIEYEGSPNEVQPLRFSIKGTNFDRYYNSPNFAQLGFHPYADNESRYNQVSSWWDENARARSQFWNVFGTGFLSTYKSIGDLMDGNYMTPDMDEAEAYADAMRIGNSTQEGVGAFFNNLFLNSAYTVGIMSNIALEEFAMAGLEMATFGGATPLVASKTAYNAVKGIKTIDKLFDVGAYADRSRKLLHNMKNVDWAKDFWLRKGKWVGNALTPNTLKALKSIDSVQGTARALSGAAKTAKTFGGMYRDFRAVNLAMAESKLEGGMVKNDLIDELYAEFVDEHGRAPSGEELAKIVRKADEAGFTTVMLNAPVIFLSNAFIFDTALRGFGGAGRLMKDAERGILNRVIKKGVVKEGEKAFMYGGDKAWQVFRNKGLSGNLKTFTGAALNYGKFNLIEGLQEITQEGIAVGAKDYYRNLYNDPMANGLDAIWASTMSGAKSQWSGEGFEVFMSGFLMGGLVQGPQKLVFEGGPALYQKISDPTAYKEYQENKQDYIKETVDLLNKAYENPEMYFDPTKIEALTQKQVNESLFAANFGEDALGFMDLKDSGKFSAIHRIIESGHMLNFKSQMTDYLKLDDQALAEAFPTATPEEIKSGKTRERIEGMLERMDEVDKAYKKLNQEIINPFDPSQFKKGSKEWSAEYVSQTAFNHAKMLALYTRDTFTRALERSNSIYSELSADPIVTKMASNDIGVLADTQQLIAEIRLLKVELRNTMEPVGEEGVTLSSDEKVIYEGKKKRLELLQDYFSVLTDPNNVEKYEEPVSKEDVPVSKEESENKALTTIQVGDSVKQVRENILSTRNIKDEDSERIMTYESGSSNPFGVFDSANIEKLREVALNYINNIASEEKNTFISHDKLDDLLTKLVDFKALKGRAEDYNKAIAILINPSSLPALAKKIEAGFWEIFMENKLGVKKRMEAHVAQTEKNEFLKQLAEYGIYPEVDQTEIFLRGGAAPYLYMTEDGVLTAEDNPILERKKDELLGTYLNLSNNKVQEKETKNKEEEVDEKYDPYNFENTHFEQDENDIDESNVNQYLGNQYGDQFLVRKHQEYLLSREGKGSKEKTLINHEDWLKSPISKRARIIESVINKIYDEIYVGEKLVGESEESFFNWLTAMKEDPRVSDIMRAVDVKITDIIEPEIKVEEDSGKKKAKTLTVKKEEVRDRLTGEKETVFKVIDKKKETISDKVHFTKKGAEEEKNTELDRVNKKISDNTPFEFAGSKYKNGDTLINEDGVKYTVFSTPSMVKTYGNIYIKKQSKIDSKSKKDKIFLKEDAFKAMNLDKNTKLNYKITDAKLKANEPLVITPIWDYKGEDYIKRGVFEQQEILRNLKEDDKKKITFKITPGPKWFTAEEEAVGDKKPFRERKNGPLNELIKKHGQKWQVEVQMNDVTIGYFMGPTAVKFLNRKDDIINPTEITETQVQDFFKLYPNDNIKDKTEQIRNSYFQSYHIYNKIDDLMKGKDSEIFTQEELGVVLNISEGSMAIAEEGDGVLFKDLEYHTLDIVDKEDLYDPEETPYYLIDYNRIYKEKDNKPAIKYERKIKTNIKTNTPSYKRLKKELAKYEDKFNPSERLGKYISFISLPNGKTAFIYTKPQTMTESEVVDLFNDLKRQSEKTVNENINKEGKVKEGGSAYNKKYNEDLHKKLFVSANEGLYFEIKISEDGTLRVDYSDLNIEKVKKGQKQKGINRAHAFIPAKVLQNMEDIQELIDELNVKMFGKGTPLKGKNKVELDNFKRAIPKEPTSDDVMNMVTLLDKQVKKNFNFSLSSTENLNAVKRKVAKTLHIEETKTSADLSLEETENAFLDDFSNIPYEILEDIAKKQLDPKKLLSDRDKRIAAKNVDRIKSIQLELATKAVSNNNTEGEAINQKAVDSIARLTQAITERKRAIRTENKSIHGKDKTAAQLIDINKAAILNDPELIQLTTKLKEAKSQANKIIRDFDGHDIEDIETFIDWVKHNLPENISVDIANLGGSLKGNYKKVGMFMMQMKNISKGIEGLEGVITTGFNSPFKYHEAFHSVFRMLLTDVEIKKYLNLASKEVRAKLRSEGRTLTEALNEMRKQHSMYAEMPTELLTERLYEEYLADEFEAFKMNPSSTNTNSENKSMFQKIIDFIIEVLTGFRTRKLNYLFEGIDAGKYKNMSIQENRFTQSFDGDVAYKLELISGDKFIIRTAKDGSTYKKWVKNYIPSDQTHEIVSGIAALYNQRLPKDNAKADINLIMDGAIADWIEMYNPDRDFYSDRKEWFVNHEDELKLLYESLLEQTEDLKDQVYRNLNEFYGVSNNIDDSDYTEQEEKTTGDYDKSADMFGGYSSLPKRLRHLIATTTIKEKDRYDNEFINEETKEPIMVSVNPHSVYNGLLKVLANTPDDLKMFQKAWMFGKNNPHTKAVVDKIFTQLGLYDFATSGDMFKKEAEMPSQVSDSSLYMSFIKGLRKYRVDNIFAQTDKNTGITHLFAANKKDDAHHTVKQWAEDFNRKYSRIRIKGSEEHETVKDALQDLTTHLEFSKIPENYDIQKKVRDLSNILKTSSGINIHPDYMLYSIYSNLSERLTEEQEILFDNYSRVDPLEVGAINMIRASIDQGHNLYLDNQIVLSVDENEGTETTTYEKGGVKGRLRKIALNNAEFDEAVGASTFLDAEGNRRHSHQDPTFHLEKIAEMDGAEYVHDKLKEDVFLEKNMLLNNPQFQEMVATGKVRALRIVGSKEESLVLGDLDLSAQKGRDVKNKGVSFGKSKPREFILDLLHAYLYNYNRVSPDKTRVGVLKGDDFATAPTFIRVLEASNTGDFVSAPVHKMLDRNKEGIEISNNAIKKFKNEIRIEFDRARRHHINKKEGISNPYENTERLEKLHTTYTLLTKLETLDRNIKAKLPKIGKDQRASITNNSQTIYLADANAANYSNLSQDQSSVIDIDGESFKMINKGRKNIADFTELEKLTLIERLGDAVTVMEKDTNQFSIGLIEGVEHFVYNSYTQKFFTKNKNGQGRQDLTIFEFVRIEEAEDLDIALNESEDGEIVAEVKKRNISAVERIEEVAKNGIKNEEGVDVEEKDLFDMVFEEVGGEAIIKERLLSEISEFILTLKEIKAWDKVSKEISEGLGVYKKIKDDTKTAYDSSDNKYWMEKYNLKQGDIDFNIAQIYLNNYINAKSFNQILLGDQALSLKDFVNAIKRAKMQNAAGASAATEIYDENVGVMHKVDHMSAIVFDDFKSTKKFDDKGEPLELQDGIIYTTEKGRRYMTFGFKGLTKAQSQILDNIQQGNTNILNNEFFGGKNRLSHKQLDAIQNSVKIVYGDSLINLKMSETVLTKELTSVRDQNGKWVAREGREDMHNMREKMEREEARAWAEGKGTIVLAVPKSSSKMMNMNMVGDNNTMVDTSDIDVNNIMDLSADSMRLQMINPSNKLEIVDARQIKNLITGEHDLNAEVIFNGEVVTIRDLIRMYHKSASDKLLSNYFAQRNLTFTWSGSLNTLDKVKTINQFVPKNEAKRLKVDLHAFVKYAIAGLEASQAKTQMLSYFKVDKYGEPQYNLNAPMVHEKFEQLFLSYFSKGILAGKQPGISAALIPDFGFGIVKKVEQTDENGTPIEWTVIRSNQWEEMKMNFPGKFRAREYSDPSKELHTGLKPGDFYMDRLRFNVMEYKDGKPTGQRYSEFMMPPHFKSMLQNKIDFGKPIPESIARMFGIRIPSQDKHSAVNLKLVDYLPVYMGSSAMYSRELAELSGADFDIDKLYMQIKEFFHDGNNFVEYGKVNSDREGYKHYVRNVLENATKSGPIRQALDRWSDKDSKTIDNTTSTTIDANDYNNMDAKERALHHKRLKEGSDKIMIEILEAIMHGVSPEQKLVDALYKRTEGLPEALDILGLPVTYDEYVAFKETNDREPYQAAINNNLLDIKFGLLGGSGMTEARPGRDKGLYFEPAVTDPIEEAWEWFKEEMGDSLQILGENQRDIDSFIGMIEAWTNTKGGADAIGSVVLPNTTNSVITEFKTHLRRGEEFPTPTMNGVRYNTFEFDYARNHTTGKPDPSTARIQFLISALITQATDNAKNPLISKLSLNRQILPTLVTMLSLGVDLKSAILMINSPTIKEALWHSDNKDQPNDLSFKALLDKRLSNIEEALKADLKSTKRKKHTEVAVNINNLKTAIETISFDRAISYVNNDLDVDVETLLLEKAIIVQFNIFSNITKTLNSATRLLNIQKGLGSEIMDFEGFQEASEELGLELTDEEFKASKIPVNLRHIFKKKGTMHSAHYEVFRELYDKLTPLVILKRTDKFVKLRNTIVANLDKVSREPKKVINRDIVNYLTIKAYMVALSKDKYAGKTLESLQNALIYDGSIKEYKSMDEGALTIKDVVDRIKMRLDNAGKSNSFIHDFTRYIGAEHEDNKSGTMKLESNTWMQFSDSDLTRVQNSILELLALDDETGTMYDDLMHLVHYLAVTRGMAFGDGSFMNVIPTVLTKDLLNSVDKVHELFLDTKEREGAWQSVFGMNFDEITNELVRGYLKSKATSFFIKEVKKGIDIIDTVDTESIPSDKIGEDIDELPVDYDGGSESVTNSKMLSNIAYRPFKHEGKKYGTVMHAFQVWKSGEEDVDVDKKYRKGDNIKDPLKNAVGKRIQGKKTSDLVDIKDPSYLLTQLVQESILQNPNLANIQGSLIAQILISTKSFIFPNQSWMSKATEKGLLNARKNLVYIEKTQEELKDKLSTRKFMDIRKVSNNNVQNKTTFEKSPAFVNIVDGTFTIDLFRSIPIKYINRTKGIRFLKSSNINTANIKLRNKHVDQLVAAGFNIKPLDIKIDGKTHSIPQVEFPAVITIGDRYFALKSVSRDGDYKKEGDIDSLIPSDSDIAYGNEAGYVEIELEGSSTQTRIGFLFGNRPTHNEIVEYGKDKKVAFGDAEVSTEQEQEGDDARAKMGLGPKVETTDEMDQKYDEQGVDEYGSEEQFENEENNLELSDEETLTDFYVGLSTEEKAKLASDPELQITSPKKVVSLLEKGFTANQIMELLKKCYI